jgi:hypothetical protein
MPHLNDIELYHETMMQLNTDLAHAQHDLWKAERVAQHLTGVNKDEEIIRMRFTILNIEDKIKQIQLARMEQILEKAKPNRGKGKD